MAVREDNLWQSWLFPPCISDFIPGDHICNLVVAVVSCIDVSEIEAKYRDQPGNPAYVSTADAASTAGAGGHRWRMVVAKD